MTDDAGLWTMELLLEAETRGESLQYLYFWSHIPTGAATFGPWVLSQWWPHTFVVDSVTYPTAEHFMMAEKARLFGDVARCDEIVAAPTPSDAKAAGRRVAGFDEQVWVEHRSTIVERASIAKFGSDPHLREFLLGTGTDVLVEASPHDPIWGIGMSETNPDAARPSRWQGLNLLGFALMRARAALATG